MAGTLGDGKRAKQQICILAGGTLDGATIQLQCIGCDFNTVIVIIGVLHGIAEVQRSVAVGAPGVGRLYFAVANGQCQPRVADDCNRRIECDFCGNSFIDAVGVAAGRTGSDGRGGHDRSTAPHLLSGNVRN